MNNFLIPANSKRSMLIFSVFTTFDLFLFGGGLALTFLLMLIVPMENLIGVITVIAPGLVTGFLVMPVPNYHNILTIVKSAYAFFTTNEKLKWKGWCFLEDDKQK